MEKWRGLISALCYRYHQYRPSQVRLAVRAYVKPRTNVLARLFTNFAFLIVLCYYIIDKDFEKGMVLWEENLQ